MLVQWGHDYACLVDDRRRGGFRASYQRGRDALTRIHSGLRTLVSSAASLLRLK